MINKIVKAFILEDLFLKKMYSNHMKNILLLRNKKKHGDGFAVTKSILTEFYLYKMVIPEKIRLLRMILKCPV